MISTFTSTYRQEGVCPVKKRNKRGVHHGGGKREEREEAEKKPEKCHWPYLEKQGNEHIYLAAKPNKTQCQGKNERHTTNKAQSKA